MKLNRENYRDQERAILATANKHSLSKIYQRLNQLAKINDVSIQIRPSLSLNLPRGEVVGAERLEDDDGAFTGYRIEVALPGLYGATSPLPNFYTEDLIVHEKEERSEARTFLDVFHQHLFSMQLASAFKHRAAEQLVSSDSDFEQLIFLLIGSAGPEGEQDSRSFKALLHYRHLFRHKQRSAAGLRILLGDFFSGVGVEINECVERHLKISKKFQLSLGSEQHELGENALVGDHLVDASGKCRITVGPISVDRFQTLVNTGADWGLLIDLIRTYLSTSVECELEFVLRRQEANTTVIGVSDEAHSSHDNALIDSEAQVWSRLGVDTWLYSEPDERQEYLISQQLIG